MRGCVSWYSFFFFFARRVRFFFCTIRCVFLRLSDMRFLRAFFVLVPRFFAFFVHVRYAYFGRFYTGGVLCPRVFFLCMRDTRIYLRFCDSGAHCIGPGWAVCLGGVRFVVCEDLKKNLRLFFLIIPYPKNTFFTSWRKRRN